MSQLTILKILKGEDLVRVVQTEGDRLVIGKKVQVDIELDSEFVSPFHAVIERRPDGALYITDMGSQSGTRVNGEVIIETQLKSGDRIQIAEYTLSYIDGGVFQSPSVEEKTQTSVPPVQPTVKPIEVKSTTIRRQALLMKPTKGPWLEVLVLWGDVILSSFTFKGPKDIFIGAGEGSDIVVPGAHNKRELIARLTGAAQISIRPERTAKYQLASGEVLDLAGNRSPQISRLQVRGHGEFVELRQGELLELGFPVQNFSLIFRYAPVSGSPALLSPFQMRGPFWATLFASSVSLTLLWFFIELGKLEPEEEPEEEVERVATFVMEKKPPAFKIPQPPPPEVNTPTPPPPPPPPKPVVTKKVEMRPEPNQVKADVKSAQQKAAETPRPNAKDPGQAKPFAGVKTGAAVKMGEKSGAAAQEKKDISKAGLFSAFSGGGENEKLNQGSSGTGAILGQADRATGLTGDTRSSPGSDLGSAVSKVSGLSNTVGVQTTGKVNTKGRGTGYTGVGAGGLGEKGQYLVFPEGGNEDVQGSIDREAVLRVIRAGANEIRSCYERELNFNPSYGGSVTLLWDIGSRGRVLKSQVVQADQRSARAEQCIRDRVESWKFPEPPEGMVVPVQYTWILDR